MNNLSRRELLGAAACSFAMAERLKFTAQANAQVASQAIPFVGPVTDPEMIKIIDRVFDITKASFVRAARRVELFDNVTIPSSGLESSMYIFLKNYSIKNRKFVKRLAGMSHTSPSIGLKPLILDSPSISLNSSKSILQQAIDVHYGKEIIKFSSKQIDILSESNSSNFQKIANNIIDVMGIRKPEPVSDEDDPETRDASAGSHYSASTRKFDYLKLHIRNLKAVRRLGLEITDWGNDEMWCGGDGIDATAVQQIKVEQFELATFSRDGQTRWFRNNPVFAKFNLNKQGSWPRAYQCNLFIAEKDPGGGFADFLRMLWESIGKDIVKVATELTMAAVGAGVGAAATSWTVAGTIIGTIVGAAVGYIAGLIIDTLNDDIFKSNEGFSGVIMQDQGSLFANNSKRSPSYYSEFFLGNALYRMKYFWELS